MKIINFIIMITAIIVIISCGYALVTAQCNYFNYIYIVTMIVAMMIGGNSFEKLKK